MLGHVASNCKSNQYVCAKCTGDHKTTDCQSETVKCVNCLNAIEKFNLNVCTDHPSYSSTCPTMLDKLSKFR